MTLTVGIDLGTTNSAIAYHDGTRAEIIQTPESARIMPSVVYVSPDESKYVVGIPALSAGKENPAYLYRHVKRLFGMSATDEDMGWQTAEDETGKLCLRGPNDALYHPADVAGKIISELLDFAEFKLSERPTRAVIGVPADFNDRQRADVLLAAETAGIQAVLIHEPTAAAIAYNEYLKTIRDIIVFDWGGGTLDVTCLRGGRDYADVLASRGNSHLGGVDVDALIVEWVRKWYLEKYGVDLGANNAAMVRVWEAAEKAKRELSVLESTYIDIPFIEMVPARSVHEKITRDAIEEMAAPLIDETLRVCQATLDAAGLVAGNIGEVVLVGGMTRMPMVAKKVGEFFKRKPRLHPNPDEVVALGAATKGAVLDHRISDFAISDKVAHDFGIETLGDNMSKIIQRTMVYPITVKREVRTVLDGQTKLSVHVLSGDARKASENTRVAAFDIEVPAAPAGEQRCELTFTVNENNIGSVLVGDTVMYDGAKT